MQVCVCMLLHSDIASQALSAYGTIRNVYNTSTSNDRSCMYVYVLAQRVVQLHVDKLKQHSVCMYNIYTSIQCECVLNVKLLVTRKRNRLFEKRTILVK